MSSVVSRLVFDIVESPAHPDLSAICRSLGFERQGFSSQRKALAALKRRAPDIVVADFFYGYGNNYAGANVSNLDVLLRSLQRFAPAARIVILAERSEMQHIPHLAALFELAAVVVLPADRQQIEQTLRQL
jgi:DNA-binding NarL/FixJ family response regulator